MASDVVVRMAPDVGGGEDLVRQIDKGDLLRRGADHRTSSGRIVDLAPIAEKTRTVGALLVAVVTEVVALRGDRAAGPADADIVVAEG